MFYDLLEIIWKEATVKLKVAELVEGNPDRCIGLPLVIDERSKIFEITLSRVADFKSGAEPCFHLDGKKRKINDFVFEAIDSEYRKSACPCGCGARIESARHFIVYTESLVFEALSDTEPVITLIQK